MVRWQLGGDNDNDSGNSGGDGDDQADVKLFRRSPLRAGWMAMATRAGITDVYVHAVSVL